MTGAVRFARQRWMNANAESALGLERVSVSQLNLPG